jgi:hypothetical protein
MELDFLAVNNLNSNSSARNWINSKNLKENTIILFRNNRWNDHTYYMSFETYHFNPKDNESQHIGQIKIIQAFYENNTTELPEEFKKLNSKKYFSRGSLYFYNLIKDMNIDFKKKILDGLNDVHYKNIKKEAIVNIDSNLEDPYDLSLFREYELNVSSEYAKNAIETIKEIEESLRSISGSKIENKKILYNLLFGSVITSLESYLGDAFKFNVINKSKNFNSFLDNYEFKKEKRFDLKTLNKKSGSINEFIKEEAQKTMDNVIFHKLELVKELYSKILNVELDSEIMNFKEEVQKRHDIFHRNGKNIVGLDNNIGEGEIFVLIDKVKKFISNTERVITSQN